MSSRCASMAFAIQQIGVSRRQVQWLDTEDGFGLTIYDKDTTPGTLVNAKLTLVAVMGLTNLSINDVDLTDDPAWDISCRHGNCWRNQRAESIDGIAIAVAWCANTNKWAAGFSCKRPLREAVAYLAKQLSALVNGYPAFIALCKSAGLDTDVREPHIFTSTRRC